MMVRCYFYLWINSGTHRENLPAISQHHGITARIYPHVDVNGPDLGRGSGVYTGPEETQACDPNL